MTKSFALQDVRRLLAGGQQGHLAARAVDVLSCPTPARRREIAGLVHKHLLGGQPDGPLWQFAVRIANSLPEAEVATALGILYCANTPLAAGLVSSLWLPCLEAPSGQAAVDTAAVDHFVAQHVATAGPTVLEKTRATLVAMLRRFGYLRGTGIYQVRPFEGSAWLVLAAVAVDAHVRQWRSRDIGYVVGREGPRRLLPVTQAYLRFALSQGEAAGLLVLRTVGPDLDVSLAGPDALVVVAEELVRRAN